MIMRSVTLAALAASTSSAQLLSLPLNLLPDIPSLLSSLGPAPITDPRFHNWAPPSGSDVRSPCPGLNALANHNFIHHDGRNMTLPHLLQGLAAGLNMGADFTVLIGGAGLLSGDVVSGAFDLNDLDQHNFPIEHDASLSRQDAYFGDDHDFYDPYWQDVLAYFHGSETTALKPAAEAIANRTRTSEATNPEFTYGFREFVFRYGETAIYLQAMGGSDATGVTRVDWVRSLFEKERLPVDLGWRPRAEPITIPSLGLMVTELFGVSPEKVPEGGKIAADTYKDVFEALVGGSEVLNNITSGLAAAVGL